MHEGCTLWTQRGRRESKWREDDLRHSMTSDGRWRPTAGERHPANSSLKHTVSELVYLARDGLSIYTESVTSSLSFESLVFCRRSSKLGHGRHADANARYQRSIHTFPGSTTVDNLIAVHTRTSLLSLNCAQTNQSIPHILRGDTLLAINTGLFDGASAEVAHDSGR